MAGKKEYAERDRAGTQISRTTQTDTEIAIEMKSACQIPRIKLDLQKLLLKADQEPEVLTYESEIPGLAYAANKESVLILTGSSGYLGIYEEDIDTVINELAYIRTEIQRRQT